MTSLIGGSISSEGTHNNNIIISTIEYLPKLYYFNKEQCEEKKISQLQDVSILVNKFFGMTYKILGC